MRVATDVEEGVARRVSDGVVVEEDARAVEVVGGEKGDVDGRLADVRVRVSSGVRRALVNRKRVVGIDVSGVRRLGKEELRERSYDARGDGRREASEAWVGKGGFNGTSPL